LKKPFSYLFWGVRKAVGACRRYAALVKLRAENPGCTLLSHRIYDARLGKNVTIHRRTILSRVCMGNFSYVAYDSSLFNVDMGNFCSIGQYVQIGLARHPSSTFVSTHPAFYSNDNEGCQLSFRKDKIFDDSAPKTSIGNDVCIGSNVIIPGGIRIGTGAIVAAGSVVVKDVPSYAVVGGNPAKVIRHRFSEEQIKILLASEWWNWPIDKINRNAGEFSDIEKFRTIVD
jgi:acetyltransferase-like isoleucine patch superfamily enzyme